MQGNSKLSLEYAAKMPAQQMSLYINVTHGGLIGAPRGQSEARPYKHHPSPSLNVMLPHHGPGYAMIYFTLILRNVLYVNQRIVQHHSVPLSDLFK